MVGVFIGCKFPLKIVHRWHYFKETTMEFLLILSVLALCFCAATVFVALIAGALLALIRYYKGFTFDTIR